MKQAHVFLLAILTAIFGFSGCGPTNTSQSSKDGQSPESQLSAQQILERMMSAYASADSYTDKAVLYLTYRTAEGRPMQEPMPWSVSFERNTERFDGRFYDSVVKYDGSILGCQVFEIESENQDNQFLLIRNDQLPMDQMLSDPIAKHFVGGFSELPLRKGSGALVESFLPPTIQLLSKQVDFPWITRPQKIERLDDQLIEGIVCFHLLTTYKNQPCEMWIEQETGLIHQILFPNEVFQADQRMSLIRDLKIVGRFHQCQFNEPCNSEDFKIVPPVGASLVTQFVKLPDPFPSELIGETAPKFTLKTPTGDSVTSQDFAGKPTVLLWIAGYGAEDGIVKLDSVRKQVGSSTNFGVVYSDAEMQDPSGASFQLDENFVAQLKPFDLQVPFYCDQHLNVSSQLQIKAIPSVVIFDKNLRIQYAKPLSGDNWPTEINNAIVRVSRGDDLAQEMIDEYGKFYANYQAALRQHAYHTNRTPVSAQNASTQVQSRQKAADIWTNDSLLQPGNLVAGTVNGRTRIAVLDGYRTIVLLDESGKQLLRKQLDLPENQAVTRLRVANHGGKFVFAAFSKLGSQVHWFDEELNPIGAFPSNVDGQVKIEDCCFEESSNSPRLIVATADAGLYRIDLVTSNAEKLSDVAANEICVSSTGVAGSKDGVPFFTAIPDLSPEVFRGWYFSDLANGAKQSSGQKTHFCGTAATENGVWQAIGLDSNFNIQWKLEIGEMNFQNDIEPIAYSPEQNIWLIADSTQGVSVVTGDGQIDYRRRIDGRLQGINIVPGGRSLRFVYTSGNEIKCCEINL